MQKLLLINLQVKYAVMVLDNMQQVVLPTNKAYHIHIDIENSFERSGKKVDNRFSAVVHVGLWLHQENWHFPDGTYHSRHLLVFILCYICLELYVI